MTLASGERYAWIVVLLVGSLLESAYMFRWLGLSLHSSAGAAKAARTPGDLIPVAAMAFLLAVSGFIAADLAGFTAHWMYLPVLAGFALWLLSPLPGRAQGLIALVLVLAGSIWLISDLSGLNHLFAVVLVAGGLVVSIACLNRADRRPGFYPFLAVMLLSLAALPTPLRVLISFSSGN